MMEFFDTPLWDTPFWLVFGGLIGVCLTVWRCTIADNVRRQGQFRLAAELLDIDKSSYATRVAGAVLMRKLADEDKDYWTPTVRAFLAWLEHPPVFKGGTYHGITDYHSADTVAIIEWLETQRFKDRDFYLIPDFAPFLIDSNGKVQRNPNHVDCKFWKEKNIDSLYS